MHHPQDFEHSYVRINGIRMHYAQAGHGPELIVMLHGFPECWWSWRHQLTLFRDTPELAARYTAVAPDLRGYNETDRPGWGYELDVLVQDVVELIRALGHRSATIVGHDWGGNIAWSLAIARPELVDRLIALNIPHPALFSQAITSNWRQMLRSWYILFFQLPLLPELAIRANGYEFVERVFLDTAVDRSRFTTEDLRIFKSALAAPGAATAAVNYYRELMRQGARGMFKGTGMRVYAPTLMVWGEQDIALGKELTYGTDRFVPDLRTFYIPNASHWVQQDQPELVNRYIRAFLAER